MNKQKILSALALVFVLSTMVVSGGALAESAVFSQKVSFQVLKTQTLDHGKEWVDTQGYHLHDRVELAQVSGGISGTALIVYNADLGIPGPSGSSGTLLPLPDSGVAYGTIQISPGINMEKLAPPEWTGNWTYQITKNKVVSGYLTATNFLGSKVLVANQVKQAPNGAIDHRGYIQFPPCLEACPATQ